MEVALKKATSMHLNQRLQPCEPSSASDSQKGYYQKECFPRCLCCAYNLQNKPRYSLIGVDLEILMIDEAAQKEYNKFRRSPSRDQIGKMRISNHGSALIQPKEYKDKIGCESLTYILFSLTPLQTICKWHIVVTQDNAHTLADSAYDHRGPQRPR